MSAGLGAMLPAERRRCIGDAPAAKRWRVTFTRTAGEASQGRVGQAAGGECRTGSDRPAGRARPMPAGFIGANGYLILLPCRPRIDRASTYDRRGRADTRSRYLRGLWQARRGLVLLMMDGGGPGGAWHPRRRAGRRSPVLCRRVNCDFACPTRSDGVPAARRLQPTSLSK